MARKREKGGTFRQVDLSDLSEPSQISELNRMVRELADGTRRTPMNVEKENNRPKAEERRFRVVDTGVGPSSADRDTQEVHFFIGNKWKRVMLEDI